MLLTLLSSQSANAIALVDGQVATSALGSVSVTVAEVATVDGQEVVTALGSVSGAGTAVGSVTGLAATSALGSVSAYEGAPPVVLDTYTGGGSVRAQLDGRRRAKSVSEEVRRVVRRDAAAWAVGVEVSTHIGHVHASAGATAFGAGSSVVGHIAPASARGIHNPTEEMIAFLLAAA